MPSPLAAQCAEAPSILVCAPLAPSGLLSQPPQAWVPQRASTPGFFWLDSAAADGSATAWSYFGARPTRTLEWRKGLGLRSGNGETCVLGERDPFELLSEELARPAALRPAPGDQGPPLRAGWLVQLGYDLGRAIEELPVLASDDLPFPDLFLAYYPTLFAYEHQSRQWWVCCALPLSPEGPGQEDSTLAGLQEQAREAAAAALQGMVVRTLIPARGGRGRGLEAVATLPAGIESNFSRPGYEAAVARALAYIAAGDAYQINLSQRFETSWEDQPELLYMRLRQRSPAPYGALLNLGAGRWACSISPELLAEVRGSRIRTRPIKGTRRRGTNAEEDRRLCDELLQSAKERAELTMIVDLERNDLGRLCRYGSVEVVSPGLLETHPTVFHRVAEVRGELRPGWDPGDILRALFPGGSVTGAPKIRAMEIIEELEPTRRGPYCGALGWISASRDLTLNLAIRTALVDEVRGRAWYQAGGGIVADSDPAQEYEETLAKAAAFFAAVRGD